MHRLLVLMASLLLLALGPSCGGNDSTSDAAIDFGRIEGPSTSKIVDQARPPDQRPPDATKSVEASTASDGSAGGETPASDYGQP